MKTNCMLNGHCYVFISFILVNDKISELSFFPEKFIELAGYQILCPDISYNEWYRYVPITIPMQKSEETKKQFNIVSPTIEINTRKMLL